MGRASSKSYFCTVGANATFERVPGAGHAAHVEQPAAFLRIVRAWLGEISAVRP